MQHFVLVALQVNWYTPEDKKHIFVHLKYFAITHEFCMAVDSRSQHVKEKLGLTECWVKSQTVFLSAINTLATVIMYFFFLLAIYS